MFPGNSGSGKVNGEGESNGEGNDADAILADEIRALAAGGRTGDGVITVATAESLTAGRVQALLGAASGASAYFLGGVTAYTLAQKERLLGVPLAESEPCAGVSENVARLMAGGARRLFGARVAVATTGFAEPAPESGVTAPFAWWAVAWSLQAEGAGGAGEAGGGGGEGSGLRFRTGRVEWPGVGRIVAQTLTARAAAHALRGVLRELRGNAAAVG
ncbi:MAG: nicotinamide-nucleotide amidohydrolase family protein [Opitutaceae bacterium]|jgi:nicotinamide-nucleotide amidase|nr:nicotinamide-nucleotide amidohydrolase family protein [Opitutaceae bacterium]